jgi:alkylation response protein AidB-like acyl-CoA dehydrogenase
VKRRHFEAEHEMFRKSFREFVKNEIAPHYDAWERKPDRRSDGAFRYALD